MKLSIIIPCYNAEPYIHELLNSLAPQVYGNDEVEVIIIDDGSKNPFKTEHEWPKVIRQENMGASAARNRGLDEAAGDYIAFIDADDLVTHDYVRTILDKIDAEHFDYCYMSWKTFGSGWQCDVKLLTVGDKFPSYNLCVWNRIYKRSMIGNVRFNTNKKIAEDAQFIREVKEAGRKKAFITKYMYFYRTDPHDSLTQRFNQGKVETERIVYYFDHVSSDMTYLIDEFKEADKRAEVILMTNKCDIPELSEHAMITKPTRVNCTEKRGQDSPLIHVMSLPKKTQVIIWTAKTYAIGGIETFIYAFCQRMSPYYDILVLYEDIDQLQALRLYKIVEIEHIDKAKQYICDTLIINRIADTIPECIKYKKSIRMVHILKQAQWHIPQDTDQIIAVSEAAKKSYGDETKKAAVIQNMLPKDESIDCLFLVTASRLDTWEKGQDRMIKLAEALENEGISYIWLYFSNTVLPKAAGHNLIKMAPSMRVMDFIKRADYLVQLSDTESFCYSIAEALSVGTPVITTDLEILPEIGVKDRVNGYVLDMDMQHIPVREIYLKRLQEFRAPFEGLESECRKVNKWREILGKTKPEHKYKPEKLVLARVTRRYEDLMLKKTMQVGDRFLVYESRARHLESELKVIEIIKQE